VIVEKLFYVEMESLVCENIKDMQGFENSTESPFDYQTLDCPV